MWYRLIPLVVSLALLYGCGGSGSSEPDKQSSDNSSLPSLKLPETYINISPAKYSNDNVAYFEFGSDIKNVTFLLSINGENAIPIGPEHTIKHLQEGSIILMSGR